MSMQSMFLFTLFMSGMCTLCAIVILECQRIFNERRLPKVKRLESKISKLNWQKKQLYITLSSLYNLILSGEDVNQLVVLFDEIQKVLDENY